MDLGYESVERRETVAVILIINFCSKAGTKNANIDAKPYDPTMKNPRIRIFLKWERHVDYWDTFGISEHIVIFCFLLRSDEIWEKRSRQIFVRSAVTYNTWHISLLGWVGGFLNT